MYCNNSCENPDNKKAQCVAFKKPGGDVDLINQRCLWDDNTDAPPGCCKDIKGFQGCPGQCMDAQYRIPDRIIFEQIPPSARENQMLDTQFAIQCNKTKSINYEKSPVQLDQFMI